MTENEAIEVLEKPSKHIRMVHETKNEMQFYTFSSDLVKAFEMAIKALEEIQEFRKLGTVEDVPRLLVERNVIHQYTNIGTVRECKIAVERMKPKKPIRDKEFSSLCECPSCRRRQKIMYEQYFCKECGQKFDWE